jgi:hypothetical protein
MLSSVKMNVMTLERVAVAGSNPRAALAQGSTSPP